MDVKRGLLGGAVLALAAALLAGSLMATPVAAAKKINLTTRLTGESEVNAAGEPNQGDLDGTGTAKISILTGEPTICFKLTAKKIKLPAGAAHIHEEVAGKNGGIVVHLAPPDAKGKASGCVEDVEQALLDRLKSNPSGFYVNVHNGDFPNGALRGQL